MQANHDKRMNSRQILDIHGREACTRPRSHQPIQDTVRSWIRGKRVWFGSGERGKTYFEVPAWALLGEVFCWDDIPSKRSKTKLEPLGACHEGLGERRHLDHNKKGCHGNQTNKILLSGDGEWHTDG